MAKNLCFAYSKPTPRMKTVAAHSFPTSHLCIKYQFPNKEHFGGQSHCNEEYSTLKIQQSVVARFIPTVSRRVSVKISVSSFKIEAMVI
jgi:hypothetical protein